jgi:hypothetical protein
MFGSLSPTNLCSIGKLRPQSRPFASCRLLTEVRLASASRPPGERHTRSWPAVGKRQFATAVLCLAIAALRSGQTDFATHCRPKPQVSNGRGRQGSVLPFLAPGLQRGRPPALPTRVRQVRQSAYLKGMRANADSFGVRNFPQEQPRARREGTTLSALR